MSSTEEQWDAAIQSMKIARNKVMALEREKSLIESAFAQSLKFLYLGKMKFTPYTTNSEVDVFLEKWWDKENMKMRER